MVYGCQSTCGNQEYEEESVQETEKEQPAWEENPKSCVLEAK